MDQSHIHFLVVAVAVTMLGCLVGETSERLGSTERPRPADLCVG